MKWLETTHFRSNVQLWLFLENATSGGAKRCVDLKEYSVILTTSFYGMIQKI